MLVGCTCFVENRLSYVFSFQRATWGPKAPQPEVLFDYTEMKVSED